MGDVPIAPLTADDSTRPPRRSARRAVVAVVLILIVALGGVFVARGSGGHKPARTVRVDLAAVAKASFESTHIHIVGDSGDGTFVADGVIDPRTLTIDLTAIDTTHGHKSRDRALVVDGASYQDPQALIDETGDTSQGPTAAQLAAFLHGRHWIRIDAAKRRRTATTDPDFNGQTINDVQALDFGGDVAAPLAQLAKAGVKVVDLGRATIDGVSTQRWRVRYSDRDLFTHDTDPPSDEPVTTVDLWVDATYHELRDDMSVAAVHTADQQSPPYHSTTTFTHYGAPLHVRAPKASDTIPFLTFERWEEQFEHFDIPVPAPPPANS